MAEVSDRPFPEQSGLYTPTHNGEARLRQEVWRKGNTVGSRLVSLGTVEAAYILGLWCADGYHRTSSIGLSNVDTRLGLRMARFLAAQVGQARLRVRVYVPQGVERPMDVAERFGASVVYRHVGKARQASYHVYVNSRPLLRQIRAWRDATETLPEWAILPYLAGRFDGDGSVATDGRQDLRIVYSSEHEALRDQRVLQRVRSYRTRVYTYRAARTWVLYISRFDAPELLNDLRPFSTRLANLTP